MLYLLLNHSRNYLPVGAFARGLAHRLPLIGEVFSFKVPFLLI